MTIDERLEKLTERHEALTQSLELSILENRERYASWGAERAESRAAWDKQVKFIGESLARLAGTAILHQHLPNSHVDRLDRLEGKP
jgi:hypothetical protein